VAFASIVFPVPGGPESNAPVGILAPIFYKIFSLIITLYFFGFFKKSTNSIISNLASSNPATSLNLTLTLFSIPKIFTFDFPKSLNLKYLYLNILNVNFVCHLIAFYFIIITHIKKILLSS
jgi:hypothetical protein